MPLFTYNLHCEASDDPAYKPGEVVKFFDDKTEPATEVTDVICYDQKSTRLDRWVETSQGKQALVELRDLRLVFPDREQPAPAAQSAEAAPAPAEAPAVAAEPTPHA